jgi:hypothetical protein
MLRFGVCSGGVLYLVREEMITMKHWQQLHIEAEEKIIAYHRELAASGRAAKTVKEQISSVWKSLRHVFVRNYQQEGGRDETTFYQMVSSKK